MTKRLFDIILSLIGLFVLSSVFFIIVVLIKLDSKGGVFFLQKRVGKGGKPFDIYKLRTMRVDNQGAKITVGNDSRITRVGCFLRKYKIDELPQLFNVLKGDMSLVGPRPEVPEYVNKYSQKDKDVVLSVRPGITDIASLNFSNESEILAKEEDPQAAYVNKILPKKLRYCRFYVQKQSFCYDIKLIFQTLAKVVC